MADTFGTFEQAGLLAIVRLRGEADGRGILRKFSERLERDIAGGNPRHTESFPWNSCVVGVPPTFPT